MHSKQFQRYLSFLTVLVIVLHLMPVAALASEVGISTVSDVSNGNSEAVSETGEAVGEMSIAEQETQSDSIVEDLQCRIDVLLARYAVIENMTDEEISNSIIAADSNTAQKTVEEMETIEEIAVTMSEAELESVNGVLYDRFCNIWHQLYAPAPIAAQTVNVLDGNVSITDSSGTGSVSGGTVTITVSGGLFSGKTNTITIVNETELTATLSFDYTINNAKEPLI